MASKRKVIKTAARMSIEKPGTMTPAERRDIAGWLRQMASHLLRHGKNYNDRRLTAAFNYTK